MAEFYFKKWRNFTLRNGKIIVYEMAAFQFRHRVAHHDAIAKRGSILSRVRVLPPILASG